MAEVKEDIKKRDAIDFANEPVWSLFGKLFVPTLLGMVSMVILNLADGAFVGHGAGSAALAAINIAAPIYSLMTGIGIMFGIGSSIVASIHLAKGNEKAARINITQAMIGCLVITTLLALLIVTNLAGTCRLFGSNEALIPLASSYLVWIAATMPFQMVGMVGSFIVRLDGSPKYSMACTLVASILNIVLDYIFIFPMHMGLEGAAIATSISFIVSALIVIYYLLRKTVTLHLYRLKFSVKSMALCIRNLLYQMKAGFPAMLGEIAISGAVIVGNFVFIKYLGEDGVAAFGVVCYCMPMIFMFSNAIVQSIQPIVSFAYGVSDGRRIRQADRVAIISGIAAGLFSVAMLTIGAAPVTSIFLPSTENAYSLCVSGMPYYGIGAIFITLNLVLIGLFQSREQTLQATIFTLLRGFVLVIPAFILLPEVIGDLGMWLAIPVAELLTFIIIVVVKYIKK